MWVELRATEMKEMCLVCQTERGKKEDKSIAHHIPCFSSFQTQSTLLQMSGTKAASKKEKSADQQKQAEAPPPTSPADDTENKR